jgi:hypothetical protein
MNRRANILHRGVARNSRIARNLVDFEIEDVAAKAAPKSGS